MAGGREHDTFDQIAQPEGGRTVDPVRAKDRRRHTRATFPGTEVLHPTVDGAGGAYLRCEVPVAAGGIVSLRLRMPDTGRVFTVLGRVTRTVLRRLNRARHSGMAVRFINLRPEDRQAVLSWVAAHA